MTAFGYRVLLGASVLCLAFANARMLVAACVVWALLVGCARVNRRRRRRA